MKTLKYILVLSALLIFSVPGQGQKKNSLRAGPGVNLTTWESYSHWIVSPSLHLEYARRFNKFFSLAAGSHIDAIVLDESYNVYHVYMGVSALVRPFAFISWLDWIETGATFGGKSDFFSQNRTELLFVDGEPVYMHEIRQTSEIHPGIEVPIRLYMVDNDRFECFVFVNFELGIYKFGMNWDSTDCGIMFGIKF